MSTKDRDQLAAAILANLCINGNKYTGAQLASQAFNAANALYNLVNKVA